MNGTNTAPIAAKNAQIELNGAIQAAKLSKNSRGVSLCSTVTVRCELFVIFVDVDLSRLPAREGFCSLDKEEIFASIVNVTG
jgi:hypothetical protein